jgi:hypothetical protein
MMIDEQKIKINLNKSKNKQYFLDKGYAPVDNIIYVKIDDLPINSTYKVKVKCDYCGDVYERQYCQVYNKENYCCKNCIYLKAKETNLKKYGVENPGQRKDIREKVEQTMLEKYGVINAYQLESVRQNTKEKYGVEFPFQSEEIRKKQQQTMLEKYGHICPYGAKNIRNKIKNIFKDKYGVDNPWAYKPIWEKCFINGKINMYKNQTAPVSSQQKYLQKILGGELNYPQFKYSLDIAFPEEKFYIEYNGGGHDLSVKLGQVSKEQFEYNEIIRYNYMKNKDWKLIRIICINDKLYKDDLILELIDKCKNYLLTSNHSWIEINMDKNQLICKEFVENLI